MLDLEEDMAAVFYGLSTFEGSFLAIRPVNSLSHYTDWTVGHVHSGTLGWVAMIIFGAIYTLVPQLAGREAMAAAGVTPDQVTGLACDTTSCTVVALDAEGRPLRPCLLWMDVRAHHEAAEVAA